MTTVREPRRLSSTTTKLVDGARDRRIWVQALAAVALVGLGLKIELPQGVQVGFLFAAALAPVWVRSIGRHQFGWALLGTGVVAVGAGLVLQATNAADHVVNTTVAITATVTVVGILLSFGLVLWARTVLTPQGVGLWFGIGLLLSISPSSNLFSESPWKFGFAIPVAVIALGLSHALHRKWVDFVILLALAGVSAASDARSLFAVLLLAAVFVLAQAPILRLVHRGSAMLVLIVMLIVTALVGYFGQLAILSGLLGRSTEARSLLQVQTSGNLLLGGRPELAATLALMKQSIWGFGSGIAPNAGDVVVAKTGLKAIGYQPENNYVNTYMFGGHIELHSTIGDLWAQCGVVGLLFCAVVLVALVWSLARRIAAGEAYGLLLFVVSDSVFNLFFSPLLTSVPVLALALGLALMPSKAQQAENGEALDRRRPARLSRLGTSRLRPSQGDL